MLINKIYNALKKINGLFIVIRIEKKSRVWKTTILEMLLAIEDIFAIEVVIIMGYILL